MIIQIVKFQSNLPFEEVGRVARERASEFQAVPGLLQKYYARSEQDGRYAGVYVWESEESLRAYRDSELAAGIPHAYQVQGPPEVDLYEIAFTLRE